MENRADLVEAVRRRLGLSSRRQALVISAAVLELLLARLNRAAAERVRGALSPELRRRLHSDVALGSRFAPVSRLLADLAQSQRIGPSEAGLWAHAVCAALVDIEPAEITEIVAAQVRDLARDLFPPGVAPAPLARSNGSSRGGLLPAGGR